MTPIRRALLATACLLGAGLASARLASPASASGFTAFAEDEDACRRVGAAAIKGVPEVSAARRYDVAYRRCMAMHGRMRAYAQGGRPEGGYAPPYPPRAEFPDAFYSVPYATPGYGYDGFSPY